MRKILLVLAVCVGLVVFSAMVTSLLLRHDETVGVGKEIRIDDFAVLVRSFHRDGDKVSLDLTVNNRAKRVDFDFRKDLVKLIDENGGVHLAVASSRSDATLAAGQSFDTTLTFALDSQKKPAYLKWNFGGGVGSCLDDLLFGDRRIALSD